MEFLVKVDAVNLRESRPRGEDKRYREYKEWRSQGALGYHSLANRFDCLVAKFLEQFPDLAYKDEKRFFDYGQRLAIYSRDGGKCTHCKKKVSFQDAEFHHTKQHSDGGPTIVSNGELRHAECH